MKDWRNFRSVNIQLKGDGCGGGIAFVIKEHDGDYWYYFLNDVFSSREMSLFELPFEKFIIPEYAPRGDCKMTLDNVAGYQAIFLKHESAISSMKNVYIGDIFLKK